MNSAARLVIAQSDFSHEIQISFGEAFCRPRGRLASQSHGDLPTQEQYENLTTDSDASLRMQVLRRFWKLACFYSLPERGEGIQERDAYMYLNPG